MPMDPECQELVKQIEAMGMPAWLNFAAVIPGECRRPRPHHTRRPIVKTETCRYDGMVHGFVWMPGALQRGVEAMDHIAGTLRQP